MKMYLKKIEAEYLYACNRQHQINQRAKALNVLVGAALLFRLADYKSPVYNNAGKIVGHNIESLASILEESHNMILADGNWRDATPGEIKYLTEEN